MGDAAEAVRVYDQAARLSSVRAPALFGRARAAKALGYETEAFRALELLAEWYVERRAWPAALVAWRRVLAGLDADAGAERERARVRVQALVLLAGETDPVVAGGAHQSSWVRRSLARMARRPR
jgi:hypothetical protein